MLQIRDTTCLAPVQAFPKIPLGVRKLPDSAPLSHHVRQITMLRQFTSQCLRTLPAVLLLTLTVPYQSIGQSRTPSLHCGEGLTPDSAGICTGTIVRTDSLQRFEIRLHLRDATNSGIAGAVVRLRATSGVILADSTTSVGPSGEIRAIWLRNRGSDPVGIGVEAHNAQGSTPQYSAVGYVELKMPRAPAPIALLYGTTQFLPAGFENTQQSRPIIVEIRKQRDSADTKGDPFTDVRECQRQRVVFGRSAGTMSPDTAVPEVYVAGAQGEETYAGCRAEAWWSLGTGLGIREARISLVPAAGYEVAQSQAPVRRDARTRPLPRFILGGVYRIDRTYLGRDDSDQITYRVERPRLGGGTITFDSVAPGSVTVDSVESTSTGVMVGVSAAILRFDWLTVTAGVDLESPTTHQYLGFSILRALNQPETLPIDFHLLAHLGEIDVLTRPDDCRLGTQRSPDDDPCETEDEWGFRGVAFMVSIDAGTLLSEAFKQLGK